MRLAAALGEARAASVKAVRASVDLGWGGMVAREAVAGKSPAAVPAGTVAVAMVATTAVATVGPAARVEARVVAAWAAAGVATAARAAAPTVASLAAVEVVEKAEAVTARRLG